MRNIVNLKKKLEINILKYYQQLSLGKETTYNFFFIFSEIVVIYLKFQKAVHQMI